MIQRYLKPLNRIAELCIPEKHYCLHIRTSVDFQNQSELVNGQSSGVNLLSNMNAPQKEVAEVDLFLKHKTIARILNF
jgi:hypothetical protein